LLAVRTLTAAALLAVFLAAVLFLDRMYLAVMAGAVVASGAYEWALLVRMRRGAAILYALAGTAIYAAIGALAWPITASAAPIPAILIVALAFWALAVPAWLARGLQSSSQALLSAAGIVVLVPAGLAMVALPAWLMLAILGLVWISDTAA